VAACTRFIDEQLGIIAPRVIAPMGNSALHHVFRRFGLGRAVVGEVHGRPHPVSFSWGEGVVFPLYHPAAILYNRSLEVELHADLEALMALLSSVSP
jgi:DNA polymerase